MSVPNINTLRSEAGDLIAAAGRGRLEAILAGAAAAAAAGTPLDENTSAESLISQCQPLIDQASTDCYAILLRNMMKLFVDISNAGSGSGTGALPAVTVAYAASITPDIDTYSIFNVGTLTGPITINAPTGTPTDNTTLLFRFVQDGTGRAITWNGAFAFSTDLQSGDIPIVANAKFSVFCRYNTVDSKYRVEALARGY